MWGDNKHQSPLFFNCPYSFFLFLIKSCPCRLFTLSHESCSTSGHLLSSRSTALRTAPTSLPRSLINWQLWGALKSCCAPHMAILLVAPHVATLSRVCRMHWRHTVRALDGWWAVRVLDLKIGLAFLAASFLESCRVSGFGILKRCWPWEAVACGTVGL